MAELPKFEMERVFDAPAELVWRAWTDAELLARWYGPGVETVIHALDVRVGGQWLNEMKWGENGSFQRSEFIEVDPPSKLVMLMSTTDSDWEISSNPMMPDWPRTLWTGVTLREEAGKTIMTLTWIPYEATEAEIACFAGAAHNLGNGWAAGFDIMGEIVAELGA